MVLENNKILINFKILFRKFFVQNSSNVNELFRKRSFFVQNSSNMNELFRKRSCVEKIWKILREMNDFVNWQKSKMITKMPEFQKNSLLYGLYLMPID